MVGSSSALDCHAQRCLPSGQAQPKGGGEEIAIQGQEEQAAGWWQVMGGHKTTFDQRLRMDDYYVSNWSLWMDFYILLKTVWVVLSGKGA